MKWESTTPKFGTASWRAKSAWREALTKDAVAEALDEHRRMGRSVPVMRDGKIIWLSGDEIERNVENLRSESAELREKIKKIKSIQGDEC